MKCIISAARQTLANSSACCVLFSAETGESPVEGYEDDEGTGASLL